MEENMNNNVPQPSKGLAIASMVLGIISFSAFLRCICVGSIITWMAIIKKIKHVKHMFYFFI